VRTSATLLQVPSVGPTPPVRVSARAPLIPAAALGTAPKSFSPGKGPVPLVACLASTGPLERESLKAWLGKPAYDAFVALVNDSKTAGPGALTMQQPVMSLLTKTSDAASAPTLAKASDEASAPATTHRCFRRRSVADMAVSR